MRTSGTDPIRRPIGASPRSLRLCRCGRLVIQSPRERITLCEPCIRRMLTDDRVIDRLYRDILAA